MSLPGELFGRDTECRRLNVLLDGLRRGAGGALVLSGEPGVGKTALLEYLARQAGDATVVSTRGLLSEASLSFAGLGDLLRPLLGRLGELPEPQSAALGAALALTSTSAQLSEYAVCVATLTLLTACAERHPVLVIVDDAQWVDGPSLAALLFSARRLSADPVGMLFAIRLGEPTDLDARDIDIVTVDGLDLTASNSLLDSLYPGRIAPAVAHDLWRATHGNPLALREIAGGLNDDQLSGRAPLRDPLPVGRDLEAAFARRLDRLPAGTRQALLVLALSTSAEVRHLAGALASLDADWSDLDPAEAAGLIEYEGVKVAFTHPLIQAAVQVSATAVARRRAYDALASTAVGEARAWYRAAGVVGNDEAVARELEATAADARNRTGFIGASDALRRAAELTENPELRARRLLAAATDAQLAGRMPAAAAWLDEARTLASDPLLTSDIDLARGRLLTVRGGPSIAQQVLVCAATAVLELDRCRAARLLCAATLPAFMVDGRIGDAAGYAGRALALLHDMPEGAAVADARTVLAHCLALTGDVCEARRLMDATRSYMDGLDPVVDARAIAMTGMCRAWLEDYRLARGMLDRVIESARRVGAPSVLAFALTYHSELDRQTGNWVVAHANAAEALRLARETQQMDTIAYALVCLARFDAAQGRAELLHQHVTEGRQVADPLGIDCQTLYDGAAMGLLQLTVGKPEDAIACLEPVRTFVDSKGLGNPNVVPWQADLVEAYWHAGRGADAEAELAQLEKAASTTGLTTPRAAAARCRGLLAGIGDDAEEWFREAMRLHEQVPQPFERARTALYFGEMLRRRRRRADSRHLLRDALHTFQRLGAQPFEQRAAAELRATGEHPRPRHQLSALQQLTGQELQVALAVARGLSNPEIAAALFISRKTVETHLSGAYRKLGLRSRTQLVRHLAEVDALAPKECSDEG